MHIYIYICVNIFLHILCYILDNAWGVSLSQKWVLKYMTYYWGVDVDLTMSLKLYLKLNMKRNTKNVAKKWVLTVWPFKAIVKHVMYA